MQVLEVKNLTKRFGELTAVDNVNFAINENSIFGLIGRNGAGKTTTIRMLMNIYLPDEGEILFRGEKVNEKFKERIGYLPEERGLYKKMKVLDTILFFAEIKGKRGKEIKRRALEYLDKFNLLDRAYSTIQDLSKGNQQKVQFITSIIHEPDFVILDEPFSGLDPVNTELLKDIILEMKNKGKIIILSTHLMDYAERLCDDIALIHYGKIILKGNLTEIKEKFSRGRIIVEHENPIDFIREAPFVSSFNTSGHKSEIKLTDENKTNELIELLLKKNVQIRSISVNNISLQEIFITLAGDENAEVNSNE